ncbi:MAG: Gfo/Idh/MocA family oxidoreductase [Armatimonadota bacterium]
MDRIGIAVVGCGMMAQGMHLPNLSRHPDFRLLWCCDPDPHALQTAVERFGPERQTSDAAEVAADRECEAVLIAASHNARLPLIELFARAGKHIYVEKPMAESFPELRRVLQVVRETGIRFTVGHNRRAAPAVREAVRVLQKHRDRPVSPPWRWDREGRERPTLEGEGRTMALIRVNDDYWSWKKWAFQAGALVNEMTHFLDLAGCFIPSQPCWVQVAGERIGNHVITVGYEDGSLAVIFESIFGSFGYPKELVEIYHNGAVIVLDHLCEMRVAGVVDEPFRTTFPFWNDRYPEIAEQGIEGYYRRTLAAQREALEKGDNSILPVQPDKGHYALLTDFARCIRTGEEPLCGAEVAAVATALMLHCVQSEQSGGQRVEVRPEDFCPG